jgi:hypothetical protein
MTGLLGQMLKNEFRVHIYRYPAKRKNLREHYCDFDRYLSDLNVPLGLGLIGHSLGGILARIAITPAWRSALCKDEGGERSWHPKLLGALQLGSPNNGASIAHWLQRFSLARWYFGPVLADLAELSETPGPYASSPSKPMWLMLGTGFGSLGWNPIHFRENNDGLVSKSEACLPFHQSIRQVFAPHPLLPIHPATAAFAREVFTPSVQELDSSPSCDKPSHK